MFGDGRLVHLPGGVEDYLARGPASPGLTSAARREGDASQARGRARAEASARNRELARLERQVSGLEQREASLHEQLASHATDYEKVAALDAELRAVRAERSAVEDAWLGLAELLPSEDGGQ
jgi:hypothetical protein